MSTLDRIRDAVAGRLPGVTPSIAQAAAGASFGRAAVASSGSGFFTGHIDLGSLGGDTDPVGEPTTWRRSTAAYRCVQTIAGNLAALDLVMLDGGREVIEGHPTATLWNDTATGGFSARTRRQVMFAQAEVKGESFAFIDRGDTTGGEPRGLWPVFDPVQIVVSGTAADPRGQQLVGYVVKPSKGDPIPLLPDEMLWLRYPDPESRWGALAPWRAALDAAGLDQAARAWQQGELANGARPSHVVYLGDLTGDPGQYAQAKAEWRTMIEGPRNAGKSLLVGGASPVSAQRLTLTPEEMSYLESRTRNAEDVMLAFGIRPDYFTSGATYENQRAAKVSLWTDVLLEKLDVLGSEVDRQLAPDPSLSAGFDVSNIDALQENTDAVYNRVRGIVYADVPTIDEARAMIGLEPLPDGQGEVTLTEYRKAIEVAAAPALAAAATGATTPPARSARRTASAVLPVPGRRVAHRGAVTLPTSRAAATRSTPRRLSRPRVLAFYDAHERIGERTIRTLGERQLRVVLRNIGRLRTSQLDDLVGRDRPETYDDLTVRVGADEVFDAAYWLEQTRQDSEAWLRGVWEGGGVQTAAGLGLDFALFDRGVLAAMDERRTILAQQVTQTTRAVLDSAMLDAAAEAGWSIDDMTAAVRKAFGNLTESRAQTIARTEVVGGYNRSSHMVARESGVVLSRTWLAAHDPRVRDSHRALDGTTVRLEQPYPNGLMHPGDPDGPADETINCRCVETYDVED